MEKDPNTYLTIEGSTLYDIPECSKMESEENADSI
jgi:hypothetical protein